jgi:5,6-dimethylbenzimidazole synthase
VVASVVMEQLDKGLPAASLAFSEFERQAVYRAIRTRRDVRRGFLDQPPLPDALMRTLLEAAHAAPSVGLMQPTRFILVRDDSIRMRVHAAFEQANARALAGYEGDRQDLYRSLKLEGILEAPQNLCLLCDETATRGHGLGRHTVPETAIYSTVCAVQNLWLAARAEGVGVGWVSILDPCALKEILRVPSHFVPVAYLCIGYVDAFSAEPDLERFGWERRCPLDEVLSIDSWSIASERQS